MATPSLTRHRLAGYLGEVLVDVRAGDRRHPRPAVVILPGFKGFKDWGMFPPTADRLARAGITAVSVNVSGSGVDDQGEFSLPDRFAHATFSGDRSDVVKVIDALASGGLGLPAPTSIGLLGHSRGGGLAVLAASVNTTVSALVTWAAISHVHRFSPAEVAGWRSSGRLDVLNARTGQVLPMFTDVLDDIERNSAGTLDILGAAGRLAVPWLILHGESDATVTPAEAQALHAAAPRVAELRLVAGAGHTFGTVHPWGGPTPAYEVVADATLGWFGRNLR
ncbi:MAG TPA: hypothetical protein VFV65_07360 [Gemmatimonadales bacterium]|nr:hypothetical protein [Gemmatimonadales bacterium]